MTKWNEIIAFVVNINRARSLSAVSFQFLIKI